MFTHYLKIAFRNMRKYKNQTLISVIGLAVGFTCFALATLLIRYEMSFDSFHKNAKQMYVIFKPNTHSEYGYSRHSPYKLAAYLKETFPEIADAITLVPASIRNKITVEGAEFPALIIFADSSFFRMFDVKILEGSQDFLIHGSDKIAITMEKARQLFGNEHPVGKTINDGLEDVTICAIVSGISKQSNYTYDFIKPLPLWVVSSPSPLDWFPSMCNTMIRLHPKTNIEAFEKKLYEHNTGDARGNISKMKIKSLTKMRYTDPDIEREVKFQHILVFSISGLLVILCSLFNYLTLFLSRFRMRQKELALRVVCGASRVSLLVLLSVEFILTLLFAVLLGCVFTQGLHRPFLTLSEIQMPLPAIYRESLMYVGGVILISLLVFWLILFIFQRKSLNLSIRRSNKKLFRKISVIVQLMISIGFAFCSCVILKQMYFLHHSNELGFSFQNSGSIMLWDGGNGGVLANQLKQVPEITEVINAEDMSNLILGRSNTNTYIYSWEDMPAGAEHIILEKKNVSPEYIAFYDLQLIAGEMLTDADPESLVLLNESAVKTLGWHEPVGKLFNDNKYTVKGVIKNIYHLAPTVPAKPGFYFNHSKMKTTKEITSIPILFKYRERMWKSCNEKIMQIMQKEFPDLNYTIFNSEEEYGKFLKSENALIRLLSLVSAICVLICVFGFVSLVSLTCKERRKEIAIRKINGATVGNILAMFAKEYFILLLIGAAIAFPAGWLIMHRWLENYVKQTSIPAWTYLSILFVLALVIVLCIGWRVYRASVENPADVVKSE